MALITWIRERLGLEDEVFLRIPLDGVKGHLYASPMPYGPYDKWNQVMRRYRAAGVEFAVMLVTDDELAKKAKRDLLSLYPKVGIDALRFPFRDLTSPSLETVEQMVRCVGPYLRAGAKVVVHCNAGTGRTGVAAACLAADLLELPGREAIQYVTDRMATQITDSQKRVVCQYADKRSRQAPHTPAGDTKGEGHGTDAE
jgi:hypothetical protein